MLNSILLGLFGMGGQELIFVGIIILVFFGGSKIPELMRGLGKGVKEFKDASAGKDEESKDVSKS